ncbi:17768_t:CDS:2, partial [Gigaspora rosea]
PDASAWSGFGFGNLGQHRSQVWLELVWFYEALGLSPSIVSISARVDLGVHATFLRSFLESLMWA